MAAPADALSPALEFVISRFARMVRSVGRRYGLDAAELDEMLQDVRIRLWRARASSERIAASPSSYVYQAARSAALDRVRRRRAQPVLAPVGVEADPRLGSTFDTSRSVEDAELSETVFRAVEGLLDSRRRVVRLHLLGYESREIARMLGWTGAKTRNLLSRGLADLRQRLDEVGVGPGGVR